MKHFHNINGPSGLLVSMAERPSQRGVFRDVFLKVASEGTKWTDSGRLLQREGAQE